MGNKTSTNSNSNSRATAPVTAQTVTEWHQAFPTVPRQQVENILNLYSELGHRRDALRRTADYLEQQQRAQQQQQQQQQQQRLATPPHSSPSLSAPLRASQQQQQSDSDAAAAQRRVQTWADIQAQRMLAQQQQQANGGAGTTAWHLAQRAEADRVAAQASSLRAGQCVGYQAPCSNQANRGHKWCQLCFERYRHALADAQRQQQQSAVAAAASGNGKDAAATGPSRMSAEEFESKVKAWHEMFPNVDVNLVRRAVSVARHEGQVLDVLTHFSASALEDAGGTAAPPAAVPGSPRALAIDRFERQFPSLDREIVQSVVAVTRDDHDRALRELISIAGQQPVAIPDAAVASSPTPNRPNGGKGLPPFHPHSRSPNSRSPPPPTVPQQQQFLQANRVSPPPLPVSPNATLTAQDLELERQLQNNSFRSQSRASSSSQQHQHVVSPGNNNDDDDDEDVDIDDENMNLMSPPAGGQRPQHHCRGGGNNNDDDDDDDDDNGPRKKKPGHLEFDDEDDHLCVICMAEPRSHIMVPCSCRTVCDNCAALVRRRPCPLCRTMVQGTIHATN